MHLCGNDNIAIIQPSVSSVDCIRQVLLYNYNYMYVCQSLTYSGVAEDQCPNSGLDRQCSVVGVNISCVHVCLPKDKYNGAPVSGHSEKWTASVE